VRVSPDASVHNRPFDDQTQPRVWLEAPAFVLVLHMEHRSPAKVARFLATWQMDGGVYLAIRDRLFADETVGTLLEKVQAYLLMRDVAIKAVNGIARHAGTGRVIPAGSTYQLRGSPYYFRGTRVFPSCLQEGPSFFIEKSERKIVAEDIAAALRLVG